MNAYTAERLAKIFGYSGEIPAEADLYSRLCELTGKTLPWGEFTGVRPVKYIREATESQATALRISEEKLALAREIIDFQKISPLPDGCFHLYIGIPFCPSRCKYCSFVSQSVEKAGRLIPEYVDLLIKELEIYAKYADDNLLVPDAVYIGGGTPTALPLSEQNRVYEAVRRLFEIGWVREYTVEAGRPETLTRETLAAIKKAGANRISVNPQSMNDATLKAIGRGHSAEDSVKAYYAAREAGFRVINMDLIAGLPNESERDFLRGLEHVIALFPDNITVHAFAAKRGAEFADVTGADFTKAAYDMLKQNGYFPYYMYRLMNSAGDNIGYARERDKMCVYNIYMTDESSTVLAAGCAGASRIFRGGKMIRKYNFKYPYEYAGRFGEIREKEWLG